LDQIRNAQCSQIAIHVPFLHFSVSCISKRDSWTPHVTSSMRPVGSTTGNAVSGSSASLRTPELDRRFSFSYMAKGLCICRRSKDCPLGHPFCICEIDRVHLEKSNHHCAYGDYLCLGCFIQQPTRRDVSRGADRPPSARLARLNISNSTYLLLYQHCTHSLRLRI